MNYDEQEALIRKLRMGRAKGSIQRRPLHSVIRKGLAGFLPTSVQKSYFLLSNAERDVLNRALEQYRPDRSDPILVGGHDLFKPALRLMKEYRLKIEENTNTEAVTTSLDGWKRCRSGENTRTST